MVEHIIGQAIAEKVMEQLGFVEANKSGIIPALQNVKPSGRTAMRDAVMAGQVRILKLNQALSEIDAHENWNFIHIVLTDGEDTSSKHKVEEVIGLQLKIGLTIPVSRLKTYFVGIDLGANLQAVQEIDKIRKFGLENSEFIEATYQDEIASVFEKIQADLKVLQRTQVQAVQTQGIQIAKVQQQNIPVLCIQKVNYVVVFNLDVSGSMAGGRWRCVIEAVKKFVSQLGQGDFVSAIVFNDEVKALDISPNIIAQKTQYNQPQQQQQQQVPQYNQQAPQFTQQQKPAPKFTQQQQQVPIDQNKLEWQINTIMQMGFDDKETVKKLLEANNGNVEKVLNILLSK